MQGFIPIAKNQIDFKDDIEDNPILINKIRAKRLIDFGLWICETDVNGKKLVVMT